MATAKKPFKATITSYQVGFGDCYLLTFHYTDMKRHVLIDFGTKFRSKVKFKVDMTAVAKQIKADCSELAMVVATHRHYDHISGFETTKTGGPGAIIRDCRPKLVVQPWTEDPKLAEDATKLETGAGRHVRSLSAMNALADALDANLGALVDTSSRAMRGIADELTYLGGDNITNRSAVENLMRMGKPDRMRYVHLGSKLDVRNILPGVKIHVLGPPTLGQSKDIKNYARRSDEYWSLQARAVDVAASRTSGDTMFRGGRRRVPLPARWFAQQLREMQADSLLQIVRVLDETMNNTSLILLFEAGSKKILFPGDAQLENWSAALKDEKIQKLLAGVDVYKVGHHGSDNATPRHALWERFGKRRRASFRTLLSTRDGEYSSVPKPSLHQALAEDSTLLSTQDFAPGELSRSFDIKL